MHSGADRRAVQTDQQRERDGDEDHRRRGAGEDVAAVGEAAGWAGGDGFVTDGGEWPSCEYRALGVASRNVPPIAGWEQQLDGFQRQGFAE
jgi:hypothetical protein